MPTGTHPSHRLLHQVKGRVTKDIKAKSKKALHKVCLPFYLFTFIILVCSLCPQSSDSELLGKALDYFQGGKFHESLLLFEKLDQKYKLNPRFRAYMGVCYYYDWEYEKACEYLDSIIPQMDPFAPHERSVYYYSNAESHFNLNQYEEAKAYYERMLNVCYDNEKSDGLYRLGYCYLFTDDKETAYEYFASALAYYQRYRSNDSQTRINQLAQIVKGFQVVPYIEEENEAIRDTIRNRIIQDIHLDDIFQNTLEIEFEDEGR